MPRNPNATRPKANTAGATISAPRPIVDMKYATPISSMIAMPSQYAEKFPATKPDRMFSDAPPCSELVTTSRTCRLWVLVKALTISGISAPASVPHVMIVESFHHSDLSPLISGIST